VGEQLVPSAPPVPGEADTSPGVVDPTEPALGPVTLAIIAPFPFAVWGVDELHRLKQRRRHP
jgi:hypothetical protein